jgi:predicted Mrr-cat superfamily restriction endonuclease
MDKDVQQAFVLRVAPSGIDRVDAALSEDQIFIGWAEAEGLLNPSLSWEEFRGIISSVYYSNEMTLRKAGAAAGNMWRFIREMSKGDLVVVPHGSEFYIAKILGPANYDTGKVKEDTAYRRPVLRLNGRKPMSRRIAKSALMSRMKNQGTCVYATDLIEEINDCLNIASEDVTPTFQSDLQARLIRDTLDEIRKGRMDSYGFESLIKTVLEGLGAESVRIVPRLLDKGADLLATFRVAGTFLQLVAIQAKHWQPEPPVGPEVVEQLIRGIEAESADLGMIMTSGMISDEASNAAEAYYDEKGVRIELVDGDEIAKLIVEYGIRLK